MKAIACHMAAFTLLTALAFADPPATAPSTAPATTRLTGPAGDIMAILRRKAPPVGLGGPIEVLANGPLESQRRTARTQQQICESQPVAGTYRFDEIMKFSLIDGFIRVDFGPGELPIGQTVFKVDGLSSTFMARTTANAGALSGRYVSVSRYDFDQVDTGEIWHASMNCSNAYLMLNAVGVGFSLSYQQSNGIVGFSVMKFENGRNRPFLYITAANLIRLQAEHPEEVRQYLVPLFRCWMIEPMLTPGATDVYTVFAELQPSPTASGKLADILPRLDNEKFTDRDAASQDLAKLGSTGILAALRLDRSRLSFEQADRIDAFIDRHRRRWIEDPQAMRDNESFLLECLADEDAAVRAAAKMSIEKTAGHALAFDPAASETERGLAIVQLRKSIKEDRDRRAATQPSLLK